MLPADLPPQAFGVCPACHKPYLIDTGDVRQWRVTDDGAVCVCPNCGAEIGLSLIQVEPSDIWEAHPDAPR